MSDDVDKKTDQSIINSPDQVKVNTIVLFTKSGDDALAVLRIIGPARQLGLRVIRGIEDGKVHLERITEGDIVWLQRDFPGDLDSYEQVLSSAHAQRKPVVLDIDDLLFELPENHPDRIRHYFTESLLPMLRAVVEVDLVTVPTNALRDCLLPFNKNIEVFPNYLDDRLWNLREPLSTGLKSENVIIGYMGGHSHKPDILMVLPALRKIFKKYPQKVSMQFWGIEPPAELVEFSKVDWCPPKSQLYADFAEYFQTQTADIMIAPLGDNLFNSCKSPIKYLEYSAIGVPGVYSRITPYVNSIDDGKDGLLASDKTEWINSLSTLIEDRYLRRELAVNAQQKIRNNWLLSNNAEKLLQIYRHTISGYLGPKQISSSLSSVLNSISRQIFDDVNSKNQKIEEKTNEAKNLHVQIDQLHEIEKDLEKELEDNRTTIKSLQGQIGQLEARGNELEAEVLSYALSTSWKITRPLRKLSRKLKKGAR